MASKVRRCSVSGVLRKAQKERAAQDKNKRCPPNGKWRTPYAKIGIFQTENGGITIILDDS